MRRHPDLGCDVLVMPHHGSARQDRRFGTAPGARLAVASAGLDNSYGHPSAKALNLARELGMQTMRTDRDGSIAIHSSGDSLATRGTHGAMGGERRVSAWRRSARRSADRACYCGRPVILAAFFPRETRSNVVRVAATQEDSCPNDRGPVDGLGQWVPVGGELCR